MFFECFLTSQTGYCFLCFRMFSYEPDWLLFSIFFECFLSSHKWIEARLEKIERLFSCGVMNIGRSRGQWKKIVISTLASNQQGYLFLVSWEFVRGSIGNQLNNVIFEVVTAKYSFLRWRVLFLITNWHIGHCVLKDL